MALYEFSCPLHGRFEVFTRGFTPPTEPPCPVAKHGRACCELTQFIFSAPARTEVKRDWNDKANDYRRDPYTQARAQLTNMDRERQERGARPMRITEQMIQVGARAIHEQGTRPRPGIEQRHVAETRKLATKTREERRKRGETT